MHRARTVALALVCSLVPAHALGGDSKAAGTPPALALAGMRACLFYEPLGKTDDRDLMSGSLALWNTIIGEGDAKAPSNTIIVHADVTGPAFLAGTKGTVSLVATSGKRVLRRETIPLATFFSDGSKLSIPFVVSGSGCGLLRLDALLTTPGHQQRLVKTIDFRCGE